MQHTADLDGDETYVIGFRCGRIVDLVPPIERSRVPVVVTATGEGIRVSRATAAGEPAEVTDHAPSADGCAMRPTAAGPG